MEYSKLKIVLPHGEVALEDAIVAWTWRKFIENREKYVFLPLYFPMTNISQIYSKWRLEFPVKDLKMFLIFYPKLK